MPNGGRLTITTANVSREDAGKPREVAEGDYVVVGVSDTGTGMTEEVLAKAFEPFYTTKPVGSGTGLGLSEVYGIAKQTGGTVSITSQVGAGTTVRVYLPRTTAHAVSHPAGKIGEASLPGYEATILVVDDDPDVRQLTASCLESLGYRVLAVQSAQGALDKIASGSDVDLVLMDIAMPEVNGVEAMAAILEKRPGLRFIYMTGYVGPTQLDPAEQRVIKKPFTLAELAEKVERALLADERKGRPDNVVPLSRSR